MARSKHPTMTEKWRTASDKIGGAPVVLTARADAPEHVSRYELPTACRGS